MTSPERCPARHARRSKRTLVMIAAAVIAPVALSYSIYFFAPRGAFTNYGELLPTKPIAPITGVEDSGKMFRLAERPGRWVVLIPSTRTGQKANETMLFATRQARTMQGRERERIERLWLVADEAHADAKLVAEHPDVVVVRTSAEQIRTLPKGAEAIYLIDPLGNLVLAWPRDPDIKALSRDLSRLLKASRIG
ncbi:MAG TPA: hypothetical protein VNE58_09330 [Casimicrobiaceae bacterium]|nr:hypothetical protein [Casimicrobiaceae bacterium]